MFLVLPCIVVAVCPSFDPPQEKGNIPSVLTEASGLAASRKHEGVLWVHNDSGDRPVVYAINTSGILLGTYTIEGATNRDWEDMAIGPGPDAEKDYLYIGDIGGNGGIYGDINIYRVEEPNVVEEQPPVNSTIGPATVIRLTYPGTWYDSETLMVDPLTKDLYVVSKQQYIEILKRFIPIGGRVFYVPYPYSEPTMQYKTTISVAICTAGDISADGSMILVRNYSNAFCWRIEKDQPIWEAFGNQLCPVPLAKEQQGEAICFESQKKGYFSVSEGIEPPLYYYEPKVKDCNEITEEECLPVVSFQEK